MNGSGSGSTKLGYIPALDGLRAVCILLVMGLHARIPFLQGGFLGVDGFFVLSGFLITFLLLKEHRLQGSIALRSFYGRRAARLFPAVLVLLLAVALYALLFAQPFEIGGDRAGIISWFTYSANWYRIFVSDDLGVLGHGWSLAVEEQFYLLWPLLLILMLRLKWRPRLILLTLALVSAMSLVLKAVLYDPQNIMRVYGGLDTRADSLLIGCALAVALHYQMIEPAARAKLMTTILLVPALLALSAMWVFARYDEALTYRGGILTLSCALFGLVICHIVLNPQGLLYRALASRPLVWIGTISYSLYLWHFPVFNWLGLRATDSMQPPPQWLWA